MCRKSIRVERSKQAIRRQIRKQLIKNRQIIAELRAHEVEVAPLCRWLRERADEIMTLRTQLAQARTQIPPRSLGFGVEKFPGSDG